MWTQPVAHISAYYSEQARRWWHYQPMRRIIMMQRNLYQAMCRSKV